MFAKANTLRQVGCRSSEASRLRPHGKPPRCFHSLQGKSWYDNNWIVYL